VSTLSSHLCVLMQTGSLMKDRNARPRYDALLVSKISSDVASPSSCIRFQAHPFIERWSAESVDVAKWWTENVYCPTASGAAAGVAAGSS
jgi:uncharacterized protein YciU (UPF0263 family)